MKWVYLVTSKENDDIIHSLEIWENKCWNPSFLILDHIKQLY